MTVREQTVKMLVNSEHAAFAKGYQQGYWWATKGKRESIGPLDDSYILTNLKMCVDNGWFDESFHAQLQHHIGFTLGMVHGAILSPETQILLSDATTLVTLHNTDFQRGYYFLDANPDQWRRTDNNVIQYLGETFRELSRSRDPEEVWHYCLGCLIGELSGQIFPCTQEEIRGWEQEHLELLGYEQHIVMVDHPLLYQPQ